VTLLAMLAGSPLLSKERQEVQVVRRDSVYPTEIVTYQATDPYKELSYDSLARAMLLVTGLTITPNISNFNKVSFIYEDSVLTDNMMLVTDKLSEGFNNSIEIMAIEISKEIGSRLDLFLETLAERKELEAKAYLAWPILLVLSLALLLFSTKVERVLLQYVASALLVASIIGGIICLPDMLIHISEHGHNAYNLLLNSK